MRSISTLGLSLFAALGIEAGGVIAAGVQRLETHKDGQTETDFHTKAAPSAKIGAEQFGTLGICTGSR